MIQNQRLYVCPLKSTRHRDITARQSESGYILEGHTPAHDKTVDELGVPTFELLCIRILLHQQQRLGARL